MDGASDVRSVRCLECVECARVSLEDERGWTARLTVDDQVAVYCPECGRLEFGEGDGCEPQGFVCIRRYSQAASAR